MAVLAVKENSELKIKLRTTEQRLRSAEHKLISLGY